MDNPESTSVDEGSQATHGESGEGEDLLELELQGKGSLGAHELELAKIRAVTPE